MQVDALSDEIKRKSTYRVIVTHCQYCGAQACRFEPKGISKREAIRDAYFDECPACYQSTYAHRRFRHVEAV